MAIKTPREILDRVVNILEEREKNYDAPRDNFQRIADIVSPLFDEDVSPEKVAAWNIGQKLGRLAYGMKHDLDCSDHWLDIIGYAVCGYRCQLEQEEQQEAVYEGEEYPFSNWILTGGTVTYPVPETPEITVTIPLDNMPELIEEIKAELKRQGVTGSLQ